MKFHKIPVTLAIFLATQLLQSCNQTCPPPSPLAVNRESYQFDKYPNTIESKKFSTPEFDMASVLNLQPLTARDTDASYYVFDSSIRFWQDTFQKTANISNISFKQWADFSNDQFDSDAIFTGDTMEKFGLCGAFISRDLNFTNTKFRNSAYFNDIKLGDTAMLYFTDASLPDSLFFSGTPQIPAEIDLSVANYSDPERYDCHGEYRRHNILLYRTDFSKFRFEYKFFHLIFDDNMHHIHISSDDKISVYESALKNFNDRGQLDSYRLLDLEYQQYKWGRPHFHWFWWLPKIWWNYGYTKELIFFWTFGLLFLFTIINYFFLECLNQQVYKLSFIPSGASRRHRLWHAFLYTSYIFFKFSLDFDQLKFKRVGYTLYILVIYVSGILCLAYLANFVIQK